MSDTALLVAAIAILAAAAVVFGAVLIIQEHEIRGVREDLDALYERFRSLAASGPYPEVWKLPTTLP